MSRLKNGIRAGAMILVMSAVLMLIVGTPFPVVAVFASILALITFVLEYYGFVECFPEGPGHPEGYVELNV